MSRLARSVCGLSAENRSAFDTAVLFLRWHQLAANPLLYRKLCALVSHEITESRLELKPGKMSTLDLAGWGWGGCLSSFLSFPRAFLLSFPPGVLVQHASRTLSLLYICTKPRAINSDLLRYKRLLLVFPMCRRSAVIRHYLICPRASYAVYGSWTAQCARANLILSNRPVSNRHRMALACISMAS